MFAWYFADVGFAMVTVLGGLFVAGAEPPRTMSPSFDGWTQNADGGYTLYFGYVNRNASEVEVPVGSGNQLEPSPSSSADAGQPTVFQPGRQRHAFRVPVSSAFDGKIVWTLSHAGRSETATGSLDPLYLIDTTSNFRGNKAPKVNAGPDQTVSLGEPVTLSGAVSDEGPMGTDGGEPRRGTSSLNVMWMKSQVRL